MDSIGEQLKQERERREFSLEQVADSTRITVRNLEAIEGDSFESFPNRVYARAFLRDYANFLGLDSAALLERYEEERGGVPEPAEVAAAPCKSKWRVLGYAALFAVVLAVLAGVAMVGWRLHGENAASYRQAVKPRASQRRPVTPEKPTMLPRPTLPEPQPAPAASATTTTTAPAAAPKPAPSDKLTVKLTALGAVWLSVKVDGQQKLYTTVSAGTVRLYEGRGKIVVRAGRANAVRVEHNGKESILGPKSAPVTRVFMMPKAPAQAASP